MQTLYIVVPCWNEQENIKEIVSILHAVTVNDFELATCLLLVDDGSTDGTWSEIQSATLEYPDFVRGIRLRINRGKSMAQALGIKASIPRADVIAVLDADGQHDPEELPGMLRKYLAGGRPQVGERTGYRRTWPGALGTRALTAISWALGLSYDSKQAEYVVMSSHDAQTMTISPWFGNAPLLALLVSTRPDFENYPVMIRQRLAGGESKRWQLSDLTRKAFLHIFVDPWHLVIRATVLALVVGAVLGVYGLAIGISSVMRGTFLGVGSIMVSLTIMFLLVSLLLVGTLGLLAIGVSRSDTSTLEDELTIRSVEVEVPEHLKVDDSSISDSTDDYRSNS